MPAVDEPEEEKPEEQPNPEELSQPQKEARAGFMSTSPTESLITKPGTSLLSEEVKKFLASLPTAPEMETLTPTDLIVCPVADGPLYFKDDVTISCEGCGVKIRHRPPPESALRHVCAKCAVIDIRLAERKQRTPFKVYLDHAGKPSK